ncbi:MAG: hypothetical protein KDA60_21880, partial [Planctomycetales bacterium]|nr:hypothetical protein [Planctomycetales bacterium]
EIGVVTTSAGNPVVVIVSPTSVTNYDYGIRDELLLTTDATGGFVRFDYDYARRRVKKLGASGDETRYLYDQQSTLVEYNAALETTVKYDYGYQLLSLVDVTVPGSSSAADRHVQFYHYDALGSTVNLSDEAGTIAHSYKYDAWGGKRSLDANGNPLEVGASVNAKQYTGHYYDEETDLHYFGARYYDDDIGLFITQDPYLGEINTPPSLHRYLYAYANPLRYVDLTGYWVDDAIRGMQFVVEGAKEIAKHPIAATGLDQGVTEVVKNEIRTLTTPLRFASGMQQRMPEVLTETVEGAIGLVRNWDKLTLSQVSDAIVETPERVFDTATTMMEHIVNGDIEAAGGSAVDLTLAVRDFTDIATGLQNGVKSAGLKVRPTSGATSLEQSVLMEMAADGIEVGIRAQDPLSAAVTRKLAEFGLRSKPVWLKAKSFFGFTSDRKLIPTLYRSDLDIAWIKENGKFIRSDERVLEIVEEMNHRITKITGESGAPFQHGSHFTAPDIMSTRDYVGLGHPGPVNVFGEHGYTTLNASRVTREAMDAGFVVPNAWTGLHNPVGNDAIAAVGREFIWQNLPEQPLYGTEEGAGAEQLQLGTRVATAAIGKLMSVVGWQNPITFLVNVGQLAGAQIGAARISRIDNHSGVVRGEIILDTDAAGVGWFDAGT